jgi:hypothetical protein
MDGWLSETDKRFENTYKYIRLLGYSVAYEGYQRYKNTVEPLSPDMKI